MLYEQINVENVYKFKRGTWKYSLSTKKVDQRMAKNRFDLTIKRGRKLFNTIEQRA